MQIALTVLSLMFGMLAEILLGRHGIPVPMVAMLTLHFCVMKTWWSGILTGCFFGVMTDLCLGRSFPVHLLILPLVYLCARWWRKCQLTHVFVLQVVPGVCAGVLSGVALGGLHLCQAGSLTLGKVWTSMCLNAYSMLLSAVLMPLVCKVLDWEENRLGLSRYSRVGGESLAGSQSEELSPEDDFEDERD